MPLVWLLHAVLRRDTSGLGRAFDGQRTHVFVNRGFALSLQVVNAPEVHVRPGENRGILSILPL